MIADQAIHKPILTGDEDSEFFLRIIRLYEDYEELDQRCPDDYYIPFRTADDRYKHLYGLMCVTVANIEDGLA